MNIERVLPGHPDKIADQIADKLVDYALILDPNAKCAFEVMIRGGSIYIAGESIVDANEIALAACSAVYTKINGFFDKDTEIIVNVERQSSFISENRGEGAGDQAIVYGMAGDGLYGLPKELADSQALLKKIWTLQDENELIGSDGKFLIANEEQIASISLPGNFNQDTVEGELASMVSEIYGNNFKVRLNPPLKSNWLGGPAFDSGVTGRKIIADTYSSLLPHGGGAFSGKDLTKVDRAGAYLARELSLEILKKYDFKQVSVSLSYEMGGQIPISYKVDFIPKFFLPKVCKAMSVRVIEVDIDKFFEKEKYSDTVKRYMDSRANWDFHSLANPVHGHFYSKRVPWNKAKGMLGDG